MFSMSNIEGVSPRSATPSDLFSAYLTVAEPFSAIPVRLHNWHCREITSASSRVMSLRRLNFTKSSRDVMTSGRFATLNTVEPCDENAVATVLSRPLMIVTTAITEVTPTITPNRVRKVLKVFVRRLRIARRKDSLNIWYETPTIIGSIIEHRPNFSVSRVTPDD